MNRSQTPTLALVGAGSLGQAFATLLAASGQPISLLATPRTAAELLAAGRVRVHGVVDVAAPVQPGSAPAGVIGVITDPADLPAGVGLIFTTKAHQVRSAAAAVRAVWPRPGDSAAWVAGVQNGLAKDDLLVAAFGRERVVGAVTILGAQRVANGQVAVASLGATYLGELGGGVSERVVRAVEALRAGGIPTEAVEDIQSVLWSKACNAAGVFGVSVLTRSSAPRLFRTPDLLRAYIGLVRETAITAAAYGVQVGDYVGFPIRSYVRQSDEELVATVARRGVLATSRTGGVESLPSMTQDLLAGRAIEVDEVFGDLVERAERAGQCVPRLRLVRDLLRGIDPGRNAD